MEQKYFELASASLDVLLQSFEGNVMVKCPEKGMTEVRRSRNACATMAIVTPEYTHYCPNQACHAGLNNQVYHGFPLDGESRVAVISTIQNNSLSDEDIRLFVDYLVNRSMYKNAFAGKDVDFIVEKGFICNTNVPSNLLAGALIASRRISEYDFVLTGWKKMVEVGVNEDAAFALAHVFKFLGGSVSVYRSSGHCSIDGHAMNFGTMTNMMGHKMTNANRPYNVESEYRGVHCLFNSPEGKKGFERFVNDVMVEAAKAKRVIKKDAIKRDIPLNPFKITGRMDEPVGVTQGRFLEELVNLIPKEFLNV